MARLISIGFESQSVTAGVEIDTKTGSPTIDTTVKRSGAASLKCSPTTATAYVTKTFATDGNTSDVFVRFYLYVNSISTENETIFKAYDDSHNADIFSIRLNSDRTLELWDEYGGVQVGSDSGVLATDTWYRIELKYDKELISQTATAYIDGSSFATGSIGNVSYADEFNVAYFGFITSSTGIIYFDDIAINDDTGSYETGLPGNGSIIHLKPSTTGDYQSWTRSGGTFNWGNVDEITPDDATTYNTSRTPDAYDMMRIDDTGLDSTNTIKVVHVGVRFTANSSLNNNGFKVMIEHEDTGTKAYGTQLIPRTTTWYTNSTTVPKNFPLTLYLDPDGDTWTATSLDSAQVGYTLSYAPGTYYVRVSTVWVVVEYTESSITINKNDISTIKEVATVYENPLLISVNDPTTIDDDPTGRISDPQISVSDKSTADGAVIVQIALAYWDVSKSDTCTAGDVATVFLPELTKTVADTSTIGESKTVLLPELTIIIAEVNNATDDLFGVTEETERFIGVADKTTIKEVARLEPDWEVFPVEDCTIGEEKTVEMQCFISVTDDLTISEEATVSNPEAYFEFQETCTIGEEVTARTTAILLEPSDTCTVSESPTVVIEYNAVIASDTSTAKDEAEVSRENLVIAVADTSTAGDELTLYQTHYNVTGTDTCTLSESSTVLLPELTVTVSDTTTAGDEVTIYRDSHNVVVFDNQVTGSNDVELILIGEAYLSILVGDTCTINEFVGYFEDALWIKEAVTISISADIYDVPVSDDCTVGESVTVETTEIRVEVSDTCTLKDVLTDINTSVLIDVDDTCTVQDVITANPPAVDVNIKETCTVSDVLTLYIPQLYIDKTETVTIGESESTNAGVMGISVSDRTHAWDFIYLDKDSRWTRQDAASGIWTRQSSTSSTWTKQTNTSTIWTRQKPTA